MRPDSSKRSTLCQAAVAAACLLGGSAALSAAEPPPAPAILQQLRSFQNMGGVLYLAAHPDDENTQLLTYLARGRGCRTAYLSLTRGDGGQNVLGPELGEKLGVIRTQELLAARRLDGGRQFFSRAVDFGFSKDYLQTLGVWDRTQVLSDIVRVIREFRPDVLITRFSPVPGGTHGHHTASAVLAVEAFKLAGDPKAFPEQLGELKPWQPKRLLWNVTRFGRSTDTVALEGDLQLDISGQDPQSGLSFNEIAARSRAMHQTQGFADFSGFGSRAALPEAFRLLGGEPASKDIFDGVDTGWSRVPGGAEIGTLAEEAVARFDPKDPAAEVPGLLLIKKRLAGLPADPVVDEKRAQLDRILQACLGLTVETTLPQAEAVPGEALALRSTALLRSAVPVRWLATRFPGGRGGLREPIDLKSGEASRRETLETLPQDTPLSQPYWLREEHPPGMFRVDDPALIGLPENPPVFPIEQLFEVGGQTLAVPDEPVAISSGPAGETRRRLELIPPVALRFGSEIQLFAPGSSRTVVVELKAARPESAGSLALEAPAGWSVLPEQRPFRLAAAGDRAKFEFSVRAPSEPATAELKAAVVINGARFGSERVEIRYAHIPFQLLQPAARLKAVSLELAVAGRRVGYLPGAGDRVASSLEQMGYEVVALSTADLTADKLGGLDAVVIGIRAFNVRAELAERLPALAAYAEAGGVVIEQYNTLANLKSEKLAPFELKLSQDRVTDPNAKVTFLAPGHPALNSPNKISEADFQGWVQERGIYFPGSWDEHFTPILAFNDPGEAPLKSGLLIARLGRGYFVYTGLSWFRQLPAGVPGAYRIFANLVSLGK